MEKMKEGYRVMAVILLFAEFIKQQGSSGKQLRNGSLETLNKENIVGTLKNFIRNQRFLVKYYV
jgi:hypothetical protein